MTPSDADSALAPPLPLRILIDQAMVELRRHFRRTYAAVAVPLAVAAALVPITQALFMGPLMSNPGEPRLELIIPGAIAFGLAILAVLVLTLGGFGALYVAAVDGVAGRPIEMGRAWRTMLSPAFGGTFLLAGLATVAGLVLCCVPGIYIGLLLALTVPVMVEERVHGTRAFGRSAELMRHNPSGQFGEHPMLKAFLISFVSALLGYAVSFAFQMPFAVLQQVLMMRSMHEGAKPDPGAMMQQMLWLQVPGQVMGMLVQVVVYMYTFLAFALLFFDLRRRREGGDIEAALGRLAGPAGPTRP